MLEEVVWPYDQGTILGSADQNVIRLKNISYAHAGRFQYPQDIMQNKKAIDGRFPAPMPPQKKGSSRLLGSGNDLPYCEECLNLSVTLPRHRPPNPDQDLLPVMVWYHGGGHEIGSGDLDYYDPTHLVHENQVIVVNMNYRLGILGFSRDDDGEPANLGLMDALSGLRWIQRFIKEFGGDPNQVTLFGQSAGADLIYHLLMVEGCERYFHRGILESPPLGANHWNTRIQKTFYQASRDIKEDDPIDQVIKFQTATLMKVRQGFRPANLLPVSFKYGVYPLPRTAEIKQALARSAQHIEILIGYNQNESNFVLAEAFHQNRLKEPGWRQVYPFLLNLYTHWLFIWPIQNFVRYYQKKGGKIVSYRMYLNHPLKGLNNVHMAEVPLLFNPEAIKGGALLEHFTAKTLYIMGKSLRKTWADFAKQGWTDDRSVPGLIDFSLYKPKKQNEVLQ